VKEGGTRADGFPLKMGSRIISRSRVARQRIASRQLPARAVLRVAVRRTSFLNFPQKFHRRDITHAIPSAVNK